MGKLEYLKKLQKSLNNVGLLMQSNNDFGQRMEEIVAFANAVYLEIDALEVNSAEPPESQMKFSKDGGNILENKRKLALWRSCSYEKNVHRQFVRTLVAAAVESLAEYKGGTLNINGYNPPLTMRPNIEGIDYDPGHFVLGFSKLQNDDYAEIDILFSIYENDKFVRRGLSERDKQLISENDAGNVEVLVYNFDEAWQITCLIAEELNVSEISIGCGGA